MRERAQSTRSADAAGTAARAVGAGTKARKPSENETAVHVAQQASCGGQGGAGVGAMSEQHSREQPSRPRDALASARGHGKSSDLSELLPAQYAGATTESSCQVLRDCCGCDTV